MSRSVAKAMQAVKALFDREVRERRMGAAEVTEFAAELRELADRVREEAAEADAGSPGSAA